MKVHSAPLPHIVLARTSEANVALEIKPGEEVNEVNLLVAYIRRCGAGRIAEPRG